MHKPNIYNAYVYKALTVYAQDAGFMHNMLSGMLKYDFILLNVCFLYKDYVNFGLIIVFQS